MGRRYADYAHGDPRPFSCGPNRSIWAWACSGSGCLPSAWRSISGCSSGTSTRLTSGPPTRIGHERVRLGGVAATLAEAATQSITPDVVARNLVTEAVRISREQGRPLPDVAAELIATAENLDEDETIAFMRP